VCSVFHQFLPTENNFSYVATFKRKVTLYAEKTGNHAAGRNYTVSEACVGTSLVKYKNKTVLMSDKYKVFFWTKEGDKS
jgi:hypothetical protein